MWRNYKCFEAIKTFVMRQMKATGNTYESPCTICLTCHIHCGVRCKSSRVIQAIITFWVEKYIRQIGCQSPTSDSMLDDIIDRAQASRFIYDLFSRSRANSTKKMSTRSTASRSLFAPKTSTHVQPLKHIMVEFRVKLASKHLCAIVFAVILKQIFISLPYSWDLLLVQKIFPGVFSTFTREHRHGQTKSTASRFTESQAKKNLVD